MAAPISETPPVSPAAPDMAVDADDRIWHCVYPSPDAFTEVWFCAATRATATRAHLIVGYRVRTWLVSADFAAVTT